MPIAEIIHNTLWQADADPNIFAKLRERELAPAMVIDLQEDVPPALPVDSDFIYLRWPIHDAQVPDVGMLFSLEQAACDYIRRGGRVVTMCAQGRNRSGLLSALVVARLQNVSGVEAVRIVRSKVPEALANPEFEAWLALL